MNITCSAGLFILRFSVSSIMIFAHGLPILLSPGPFIEHVANEGIPLPTISGCLAISAETIFPLLIILGIFTRFSAFVAAVNMFVAAFVVHLLINGDPFSKWEKALIYMIIFAVITIMGPGEWTVRKLFGLAKESP